MKKITSAYITPVHILLLSITLVFSQTVCARNGDNYYNRVRLSATASTILENDTMVAVVFAEEEGSHAADISAVVNKKIRQALVLIKQYPAIKYQTNTYTTQPVYQPVSSHDGGNKIKGWRIRQSLRLQSRDMTLMSDVLGRLQTMLALQSMQFSVALQNRHRADTQLINKALAAFTKRAQQIAHQLGYKGYKIVDIALTSSGNNRPRPYYAARVMAAKASTPPAVAAGEQTVSMTVNGSIELGNF